MAKPHVVTLLAALHRDLPGHSRTHARRFGTATIHAGFGWGALSACFETRASACGALSAYAPFRALSPVTGRFACFETLPAGAVPAWRRRQGLAPPAVRDPETYPEDGLPKWQFIVYSGLLIQTHRANGLTAR